MLGSFYILTNKNDGLKNNPARVNIKPNGLALSRFDPTLGSISDYNRVKQNRTD